MLKAEAYIKELSLRPYVYYFSNHLTFFLVNLEKESQPHHI